MVTYKNDLGFAISFKDENWFRLSPSQKEQFGISPNCVEYFVNQKLGKEFMVVFDGYLGSSPIEEFFSGCVNNLKNYGAQVLNEENFLGQGKSTMIKAKKTFSRLPNGITQTSYYLQLNKDGAVGCLTISSQNDHDENECILVDAINNFEYL